MRIPNLNLPGQPRRKRRIGRRTTGAGVVVAIIVALIAAWNQRQATQHGNTKSPSTATASSAPKAQRSPGASSSTGEPSSARSKGASDRGSSPRTTDCADTIKSALEAQRSDVLIECSGDIIKVLEDDNDGSRHQRFLVKLSNGVVIKVSHNIDLAPRVPAQKGDRIEFKGEFEWNDLGGVVHWTHHDPGNRREGGWIRFDGETYE